jgi:hypothetical protein
MKKLDLSEFEHDNVNKLDVAVTSVTLEKKHVEFIRKLNLNLSKLIRHYIDELIEGQDNEKK